MRTPFAEVVNWEDLRDTCLAALVAGVGISAAYGFTLLGAIRAREHYQQHHLPLAALYGAIAVGGLAGSVAGIVLGLIAVSGN